MDLSVFHNVILPLLEMQLAVLILISTPVSCWNFLQELLHLKFPGTDEYICDRYIVTLICDMCLKFSKEPSACTHNLKYLPEWKSSEKLDIVKLILKDNQTILKRESMGV